jgi:hypothetical protein
MGTPSAFEPTCPVRGTQRNLDVFRELGNKKKGCRRKQPLRQAFHNLTNSAAPKYQLFVQRLLLRQFGDRLSHVALGPVWSVVLVHRAAVANEFDIGAFAGIEGFASVGRAEAGNKFG